MLSCRDTVALLLAMSAYAHHAEAISPRRLVEVVDISSPSISPDGKLVAFRTEQASIERNTYDSVWYVQSMDGESRPERVGEGGVPLRDSAGILLPSPAVWDPDGRWIYFRALVEGAIDVWRAASDGSGAEPITLDPANVREFRLSTDDEMLSYSVGATRVDVVAAEEAEYDRGIRIDHTVPIGQGLFRSGYTEGRLATQRLFDNEVERSELLGDAPDRWKVVSLKNGVGDREASHGAPPVRRDAEDLVQGLPEPWKTAWDPKGNRVAVLTRVGDDSGLAEKPDVELSVAYGIEKGGSVRCVAKLCRDSAINGIQWRPSSDEVLFTVTDPRKGNAQSIFRWNVETGVVRPVVYARGLVSGGGRYEFGECGVSFEALACVAAEADSPPRLERVDLETGRRQVLYQPNAALARDMAQMSPASLLRWTDDSGQWFTGQLFRAQVTSVEPPPLFVTYYRCSGFVRGGVGDEWPLATLAQHGVSSLCINAAPLSTDAVERYDQGRSAVESVVELLASRGEVNRARVGMGGLSFGTEVTLWTAINSDVLAAASVSSLAISPTYYLLLSNFGEAFFPRLHMAWQLGAPDQTPERWRTISPAFNLERIQAPILMQLPEQEYIHSLDYAIPLMTDQKADLYVFPHEPHQKFQPRHKLAVYERNLDWFRFWLQDIEDSDPGKAAQYANWRSMRQVPRVQSTFSE